MKPFKFPEANASLARPTGVKKEDCSLLPVFKDGTHVISAWRLTDEDLERIKETRTVWLWVWGPTMYPSAVATENPFTPASKEE